MLGLFPKASIVHMGVVEVDIADISERLGAGNSANMVAVDGDLLANVTELQRVTFVVAQGIQGPIEGLTSSPASRTGISSTRG